MKRIALLLVVALVAISLAACTWFPGPKDAVVTAPDKDIAPVSETSTASINIEESAGDVATSEASIEIIGEGAPSAEEMMKKDSETSKASININGVQPGLEPAAPVEGEVAPSAGDSIPR